MTTAFRVSDGTLYLMTARKVNTERRGRRGFRCLIWEESFRRPDGIHWHVAYRHGRTVKM